MTGAMYAAIAGLKSHMSKLNVVGNNIANVNTNGYKSQRTVFRDALYTMYSGGSDGTTTTGSKNPSQIGYGSQVSSIDLNMTTGNYSPGNTMDCMLYGDGFFLVGNKTTAATITGTNPDSFKALKLTRVGDFRFGADGYLVDGKGNPVYGFMNTGVDKDGKPQISDQLVPIRLPKVDGKTIKYAVEKDKDGKYIALKDAVGHVDPKDDASAEVELPFASLDSISIDTKSGRISGTVKDTDTVVTIGYLAVGNPTNPDGVTHEGESYYSCSDGAGDLKVTMLGGVAADLGITHVNGHLDKGDKADADFTPNAKAAIGSAGSTTLYTGGLEGSNVDLATEISEMITTQRGYQANTRIITVTDSMLEELVNMKR